MKLDTVEIFLVGTNLILGIFFCFIVTSRIAKNFSWKNRRYLLFILLLIAYFFEGISIAAGMLTPIITFGLATVIGVVFGIIVKKQDIKKVVKSAKQLSVFLCIPAITLIFIPIICFIYKWDIFSSSAGIKFGIPEFIPFPFNTIFYFYLSIMILFIAVNIIIINGTVSLIKKYF